MRNAFNRGPEDLPVNRGAFDIYQTRSGYTAVDNEVQRQILEALEKDDLQLPDLVEATGKSKPTLSATHMKELLNRELVEELPHPSDRRKKVYHLIGTRIGSSDIPVPQLRRAVESYVSLSPVQPRLPLLGVLASIAVPEAPAEVLWHQGHRLGGLVAGSQRASDERSLWMRLLRFLEEQGVGHAVRMDLDEPSIVLEPGEALAEHPAATAHVLAGALTAAFEHLDFDVRLVGRADDGRVVLGTA